MRACGFVHSTLVMVPVSLTGLSRSNSAENEWCARLAASGHKDKAKAAATMQMNDGRLIGAFSGNRSRQLLDNCSMRCSTAGIHARALRRPLRGDDTLRRPFSDIEPRPSRATTI